MATNTNNPVNPATDPQTRRNIRFEHLLQGGHQGYLDNFDGFDNDTNNNAYKTTQIVSNVTDNFSKAVYTAAASGQTMVSVNNQRWDLSTAEGAYAMQSYFLALTTAAKTVTQMVSNGEKEEKFVSETMTK